MESSATSTISAPARLTAVAKGGLECSTHRSVCIVSINYAPEMTGIAVYSTGMADYLARSGHSVKVIAGFQYYPHWRKQVQDRGVWSRDERVGDVPVRRCYLYVPKRPNVLRRIAHELSFVASATLAYLAAPRAEITIVVSPPLFLGLPMTLAARLKGSKIVFHVQDLQPDAAVDLGMLRRGLLTRVLFGLERWTYRMADCVSAISPAMLGRIARKGIAPDKLRLFRNWANDDLIAPLPPEASLRTQWGLEDRFVVLYAGNMGVKQGLEILLQAADDMRGDPQVMFVLVGDGGEKPALQKRAGEMGLNNVMFQPLQPMDTLSRLLCTADVSVIPQKPGVTDIVLPSKLPNIMASAKPLVVTAAPGTELHRTVHESDCGLTVAPGDARALADALRRMQASPLRRQMQGAAGRRYVLERLSRDRVLGEFEAWIRAWRRES